MSADDCNAVVLISGSGTNLQSFIDRTAIGELGLTLALVISNRAEAVGLKRANDAGIPTACIEHRNFADRETFDRALAGKIDRFRPRMLILAGFMRIFSPWFVTHYQGRMLNIHPSLLPAYPALDTHRRVLNAGERWHGSTVHFVTAKLDGGPRILQGRLPVDPSESADELRRRVQAIEHRIYPQAAAWFASGRLSYQDGAAWLDDRILTEPVVVDFS